MPTLRRLLGARIPLSIFKVGSVRARVVKLRSRHHRWMLLARLREVLLRKRHLETLVAQNLGTCRSSYRCSLPVESSESQAPEPLRIVFVAPEYDYGNKARGLSYEENNFLHVLLALGHDVIRFDPMERLRRHGRRLMNRLLVETVYRTAPDVVFCVLFGDELEPRTLSQMKDLSQGVLVNWFTDDHWRFEDFSSKWARYFDWVITTDGDSIPKYARAGITNVVGSQWACNHRLCYPMELEQRYDVTFVGQPYGERRLTLERLARDGIDLCAWGYGSPRGRLTQLEMLRVFNQSKINLNLSNASFGKHSQVKGRHFEVPGSGGFLLTDHAPYLETYYEPDEEIVCYKDYSELLDKISYYLANEDERRRVARRGYERTLRDHTYDRRFREIFEMVLPARRMVPVSHLSGNRG